MRVAVVGAGGAGLVTAWLLGESADVTLFEASDRLGGHIHTVRVDTEKGPVFAELGYQYFFDRTYPVLRSLHRLMGQQARPLKKSLTVVPRPGVVLAAPPRTPMQVLRWLRHLDVGLGLLSYWRLMWHAGPLGPDPSGGPTLRDAALARGISRRRVDEFLLPLIAANWGSPLADIADNPAWEIREVLVGASGPFLELLEGNGGFVKALHAAMPEVTVRLGAPVLSLAPERPRWRVVTKEDATAFDHVVIATEAPVAAALLAAIPGQSAIAGAVGAIRTYDTTTAVHRDAAWMPPRRSDWRAVNVFFHPTTRPWMTDWPGQRLGVDVFRSWVPDDRPPPAGAVAVQRFRHIVFRAQQVALERTIAAFNGTDGLWLAGMYARGSDLHENAVKSGIAVAQALAPDSPRLGRLRAGVPAAAWPSPATPPG